MRNRFFRFIAHIRETERFAFDFAVARVDDQMMFAPQFASELQNVDAAVVFHASKRFRPEAFLSEKVKTGVAHPIVHECIRARMSTKALVEALLENLVELRLQGVNMRDAGRARRHPFGLLFFELNEIEVKTTVRNFFRARKSLVGSRKQ